MLGWQEVVLIIVLLFFVFGPTKLPKIARELGKAMREFTKATSGLTTELNNMGSNPIKNIRSSSTGASRSPSKSADTGKIDKTLSDIAKKLNITTEGKTKEHIVGEINERLNSQENAPNPETEKR